MQTQRTSCIRYVDFLTQSLFDSNMSIAHTISSDAEMRKSFANTISKRIPLLKYELLITVKVETVIQVTY